MKAAVVMSLTGSYAFAGVPIVNGMKIAQEDLEKEGYWGSNKFEVSYQDNRSDKQEAITLLNKFAQDPSTLIFIGPTSTAEALAAAPAANELKIPLYSNGTHSGILAAGPWSFKSSENAKNFVKPLGEYIARKLKPKSCYLVSIRDNVAYKEYAEAFAEGLKAGATRVNGNDTIVTTESDFTSLATKIVDSGADCVYVSTLPEPGANFIIQLRQAGLPDDAIIVSTQNAAGAPFIKTGGAAVEGTYFIAEFSPFTPNEVTSDFITKYTKSYGNPPDTWAAIGYSMLKVAAHSIRKAANDAGGRPTRDQVREAMANAKDVPVVIGEFGRYSVDKDRVPHFAPVILQLKNGKAVKPN
ncbi:ABC transporter substrate-binding protein [Tardiphaga sp. OK246]|uniref:ABC transporter substrate-binding protein n=1 Tax=Tardiphaga sp. OK246 TaxID=1855307 RepID=UPI001595E73D|nr:ABC transporter substrate-binding protein [Tardiphaga sp. OK246]